MNNSQYTFNQNIRTAMKDLITIGVHKMEGHSRSTMYRWANEINRRIELENAGNRVKVDYKNQRLVLVTL